MEDEKNLGLNSFNTEKKLEKHSATIRAIELQEKINDITDSSKLEEITKSSENILQTLQPVMQNIQKMALNFSSIFSSNLQRIKPVLEKIGSMQIDFFSSVQWETLQNIAKRLEKMTPEEMEALVEEVNKEKTSSTKKKRSKKTSKLDKIVHDAQQKALSESYIAMLNGTATNQLTNINTNATAPTIDIITGNATIEQGTLKVFIDKYSELKGVRTSTLKLLDACTMYLTKQNTYRGNNEKINTNITIPLEQYMTLCGIPLTKSSKDKTRRKVKEDLETLFHMSLEWTESSGKKIKDFAKMRMCDKIAIVRGNINFNFSKDMARYLTDAYIMQYPMELLKVDERNSNLYPLGRKLLLHYSINNNRKKGTSNIISVKALLEVCPDIPTYENVMSEGRQLDQRIKNPLQKALDALKFINWEYSNSKGIPLTEEQLLSIDYKTFEKLYIKFNVIGFPVEIAKLESETKGTKPKSKKKKCTSSKNKNYSGLKETIYISQSLKTLEDIKEAENAPQSEKISLREIL